MFKAVKKKKIHNRMEQFVGKEVMVVGNSEEMMDNGGKKIINEKIKGGVEKGIDESRSPSVPSYQVSFHAGNCGKRVSSSKRRIQWRFGLPNVDSINAGKVGKDCQGEEHDVVVVWSVTSGKRFITMDEQEIVTNVSRSRVLRHSWIWRGNQKMTVIANLTAVPGFRQYDLLINGNSFFEMPKLLELGFEYPLGVGQIMEEEEEEDEYAAVQALKHLRDRRNTGKQEKAGLLRNFINGGDKMKNPYTILQNWSGDDDASRTDQSTANLTLDSNWTVPSIANRTDNSSLGSPARSRIDKSTNESRELFTEQPQDIVVNLEQNDPGIKEEIRITEVIPKDGASDFERFLEGIETDDPEIKEELRITKVIPKDGVSDFEELLEAIETDDPEIKEEIRTTKVIPKNGPSDFEQLLEGIEADDITPDNSFWEDEEDEKIHETLHDDQRVYHGLVKDVIIQLEKDVSSRKKQEEHDSEDEDDIEDEGILIGIDDDDMIVLLQALARGFLSRRRTKALKATHTAEEIIKSTHAVEETKTATCDTIVMHKASTMWFSISNAIGNYLDPERSYQRKKAAGLIQAATVVVSN